MKNRPPQAQAKSGWRSGVTVPTTIARRVVAGRSEGSSGTPRVPRPNGKANSTTNAASAQYADTTPVTTTLTSAIPINGPAAEATPHSDDALARSVTGTSSGRAAVSAALIAE